MSENYRSFEEHPSDSPERIAPWFPETLKTYKDLISPSELTVTARKLIEMEHGVPIEVRRDTTLRIKAIDECGHGCVFCHNEGTLVNEKQTSYRTSVFLPLQIAGENDAQNQRLFHGFQTTPIQIDDGYFLEELESAREFLQTNEIHLTGGEPTSHSRLPEIVTALTSRGFTVKMTSNGEHGAKNYRELAEAGLVGVNMSIFGSTPEEYAQTQPAQFGVKWATHKLNQSRFAIAAARSFGLEVKANCVISDSSHCERFQRLIDRSREENFELRVLNDLSKGKDSVLAIYNLLGEIGAMPVRRKLVAGAAGAVTYFQLPSGQEIGFKQLRKVRLKEVCSGCHLDSRGK